ncbi:transcriptional regulator family: Fungal Specific TF [Penicillium sp. IBT 18751x]|nr:transcriptional regulator family: Fungal Specific TF [Penicillium sp. IBT 18751x]
MAGSKRGRSRRSHVLGGCSTCRRRHVKCDQKRPACRTCRAVGIPCEGFSNLVLWARDDENEVAVGVRRGTRRHLYTEQSRRSMSTALSKDLLSGSIDASLTEVDSRSRDLDREPNGDIVIGPFAVLDFTATVPQRQPAASIVARQEDELASNEPEPVQEQAGSLVVERIPDPSPAPIIDCLSHMDDFLHWSDLLSFSPDQAGLTTHPTLSTPNYFSINLDDETGLFQDVHNAPEEPTRILNTQQASTELTSTTPEVLRDAQFLLGHFQNIVIPRILAIPFEVKSPWKILNLPAAVMAFGDTTFLGSSGVSHARLANLYGVLACSAIDLALKPSAESMEPMERWYRTANQTYQLAKDHMQISLQQETHGPSKAKYKDQLMAANILTQYAILSGQQQHARCFLVDAERLLRLRGLSKKQISKKARLLHHVYTWLRIVGESTFVLHDYSLSYPCLESLGETSRSHTSRESSFCAVGQAEPTPRLDDFLRLESQTSDNDLNIDEPKDRGKGFHDIHLHDS